MCIALCQFRHDTELARSILAKDEVNSQFSGDKPWERRTGGLIRQAGSVPSASGSASICRDDLHSAAREICPFPKDASGGYSQLLGRIQTSPAACGCTAAAVTVFRPEGSSGQNTAILRRPSGRDTQVTRNYCCRQMAASRRCRSHGRICDHQCSVACGRMTSSGSGTSNSSAATSARRCIAGSRSCQCSLLSRHLTCSPCSISITGNRPVSRNEVSNAARRMESGITGHPSRCRVAALSGNSITADIVMQICSGLSSGRTDRGHCAKNCSEFSGCVGRGEHNVAEHQHRINGESWVPSTLASSFVDTEFAVVQPRGFLPFLP